MKKIFVLFMTFLMTASVAFADIIYRPNPDSKPAPKPVDVPAPEPLNDADEIVIGLILLSIVILISIYLLSKKKISNNN